jgi:hypothetical protein
MGNSYNLADKTCHELYTKYESQQKRLGQIRLEINALNEKV